MRKRDIGGEAVAKTLTALSYPIGITVGSAILKYKKGKLSLKDSIKAIHNAYVRTLKTPIYYKTKKLKEVT